MSDGSGQQQQPTAWRPIDEAQPITSSPDHKPGNGFARMVKNCWEERSLAALGRYITVPAKPPGAFANQPLAELAEQLKTDDEDVAKALLAEAEAIFKEPEERIEGAERRATTLQGTVAVAASVAAAGGGLLLDPTRVEGQGWRIAFALLLFVFVLCLVGCAVRALGATSRIFNFEDPGPKRITDRAAKDKCEVLTYRAAELLRAAAVADEVGKVKVGLLRSAAWWFRSAILVLALLTGLIAAYAIAGPQVGGDQGATSTATSTSQTSQSTTTGPQTTSTSTAPPKQSSTTGGRTTR